jgi:hypothetical protein
VKNNLYTISKYVNELHNENGDKYLTFIEENIVDVIKICSYNKSLIHEAVELITLVSYASIREKLISSVHNIASEIKKYYKDSLSARQYCNELDISIYFLFETSESIDIKFIGVLDSIEHIADIYSISFDNLSRGLRGSFLKGFELFNRYSKLNHLMANTRTSEYDQFEIIKFILSKNKKITTDISLEKIIKLVFTLPEKSVITLARELRRTNIRYTNQYNDTHNLCPKSTKIINYLKQYAESSNKNENILYAQLLILTYAGIITPIILTWIHDNYQQKLISKKAFNIICGLLGFDIPLTWDINKINYISNNITGILPPSHYNCIQEYFCSTLDKWERCRVHPIENQINNNIVSVIITTYNPDVELFRLALRSVLIQTHACIEIIVIDDNSNDKTSSTIESIIQAAREKYKKNIYYYKNSARLGQYSSRNIALKYATGSFITIQDDDDISHPEKIRLQINKLYQYPDVIAVQSLHLRISPSSSFLLDGNQSGELYGDSLVSTMWRSKVFKEVGNFKNLKSRGDVDFKKRIIYKYGDSKIALIMIPLVLMRGDFATVSSQKEYYFNTSVKALRKIMDLQFNYISSISALRLPHNIT